jgi:hypothetical protein
MGDPSLGAVTAASPLFVPGRAGSHTRKAVGAAERAERLSRRFTLRELARATSSTPYFSQLLDGQVRPAKKEKSLRAAAKRAGLDAPRVVSYGPGARARGEDPSRIHVALTRDRRHDPKTPGVVRIDGVELVELHGTLRMRRFQSR